MLINCCNAQKSYIKESLRQDIRVDGRKNSTKRQPSIKSGILKNLIGSSYLFVEYENIQIYSGVKLKLQPKSELTQQPTIILELHSMKKLTTQQSQVMNNIQNVLQTIYINKLIQKEEVMEFISLKESVQHKLRMYIDVFILRKPHLCLLQLIHRSISSALNSTSIPDFMITYNQVTQQQSVQMLETSNPLKINKPIDISIIGVIDDSIFITDMRQQEYDTVDACLLISVCEQKTDYVQTIKGSLSISTFSKAIKYRAKY